MIAIRAATPADRPALERLAGRDSAALPRGPLLVAFEHGELRAALSLASGGSIADPFHPTAHLTEALRAYAGSQPRTRSIFGSYSGSSETAAPTQRPKTPTSARVPTSTAAGRYA
jgi:hypothetical protein